MYNAIIIDDERKSSESLEWQIGNYCPSLKVVAIANSAEAGIEAIKKYKPDLIFLDIEMPNMNGFELLEQLNPIHFEIIFTTAHNEFAMKAFKVNALDYLLKPVDATELKNAVEKFEQKMIRNNQLNESKSALPFHRKRLAITTTESLIFVEPDTILYCESNSNYTNFYLAENKKKMLVAKTLKDIEVILVNYGFFRIHNSHLVNMTHVKEFVRGSGGYVIMTDGSSLTVSRSRRDEFFNLFSKF
jgi:two-component system LytT family response regulator